MNNLSKIRDFKKPASLQTKKKEKKTVLNVRTVSLNKLKTPSAYIPVIESVSSNFKKPAPYKQKKKKENVSKR